MRRNFERYNYVSFDIFDTLVNRDVVCPDDVFRIVQIKYGKGLGNFVEKRKEAQRKAYENTGKEEITIDDIYGEMEKVYSKKVCRKLETLEKETEINICAPNIENVRLYNSIRTKKIIASDIYLDEATIREILKKCGVNGYDKLYLSSSLNKRKSTTRMFKYIKQDLGTRKVLHIGNDLISDFVMPRLSGFSAKRIKVRKRNHYRGKSKSKNYEMLARFISNHLDEEKGYYYNFGYEVFGPILNGFARFLVDNIETKKKYFLARDGYLIQKAYNLFSGQKTDAYFYASRRSLIVPTLWMDKTLKEMTDKFYIRESIEIGKLFEKFGLEEGQYKDIVEKFGYKVDKKMGYKELFEDKTFRMIFKEIKPIIDDNSKKEYEILKQYMKQQKFSGDLSIIDIGWNGNMQVALTNMLKSMGKSGKMFGYYVGILPESRNIKKVKMQGYLFDSKNNYDIYLCLKVINSIFESLFLAPHGSVKKFKIEKGKVVPVLYEYECGDVEVVAYRKIQEGSLDMIANLQESDLRYLLDYSVQDGFANMMEFAYHPKKRDVEAFGDFRFLESDVIYLAKPQKLSYYIIHPMGFFRDLYKTGWTIGFMKRLTKIDLGYVYLYKFMIKRYLKVRNS